MERNKSIDAGKGIAIILMVIGHCYSNSNVIVLLINAFHMPFFFIISGILYKLKTEETSGEYVFPLRKRIRTTFVPYVTFGVAFSLMVSMLAALNQPNAFFSEFATYVIKIILLGGWQLSGSYLVYFYLKSSFLHYINLGYNGNICPLLFRYC